MDVELLNHQYDFLADTHQQCLIAGGIGCIHDSALLDTVEGLKHPSEIKGETFYKSYTGSSFEYVLGSQPYLKGEGDLYRVSHEQGEFVALGAHLNFFSDYSYLTVEEAYNHLYACSETCEPSDLYLLSTTLGPSQLIPPLDVYYSCRILLNSLDDYLGNTRSCGEQLRGEVNIFQELIPSPNDAHEYCRKFFLSLKQWHKGDLEVLEHIHSPTNNNDDLLSKKDFYRLLGDLASVVVNCTFSDSFERILESIPKSLLSHMKSLLHRIIAQLKELKGLSFSFKSPYKFYSKILAIEPYGKGEYWDLEVYGTHNYVANGAIHHNSAKTTSLTFFIINMSAKHPNIPGLITANTYSQLQSATIQSLSDWCEFLGIPFKTNYNKKEVYVGKCTWLIRSADKYNNNRGFEVGMWAADEALYYSKEAYDVFIGRLRFKKYGSPLQARFASTPNSYNWGYHLFHKDGDNHDPKRYKLIHAKTSDNTFLDDDYIDMLKSTYSAAFIRQEIYGEFVAVGGNTVYEFDSRIHSKPIHHLFTNSVSQQLYVFVDYNLDPFAGIVGFMEKDIMYIIDEIYLEGGTDVRQMAQVIKARYGHARPIVIGDSTGNNKRNMSNLRMTSYQVFKEEGLTTGTFTNPHVYKRIANINGHLYHNRLFVDPRCKRLQRDLELVHYKEGTNEIDKSMSGSNKELTHISDAAGYFCWKMKPLATTSRKSTTSMF